MVTAEHLSLVTAAEDRFTESLTRLSGLLETAAEQADQLDPIRIRVAVDDRQLDKLQRNLASAQAQASASRIGFASSSVGDGDVDGGGASHSIGNVAQRLEDNIDSLDRSIARGNAPSLRDQPLTAASMQSVLEDVLDGPMGGGGDGGDGDVDFGRVSPATLLKDTDFGVTFSDVDDNVFDASNLLQGKSPFTQPSRPLNKAFSSQAFMRALDTDAVIGALGKDVKSVSDLMNVDTEQFVKAFAVDNATMGSAFQGLRKHVSQTRFRFERLKSSLRNARVGMTQFYDIVAAGIPLLLTFVGTMPLVIGGLAALGVSALAAATTLAAFGGVGLLGAASMQSDGMPSMEDVGDVFDGVGEDFFESFRDAGEALAPTFEDGVDGLSRLFDRLGRVSMQLTHVQGMVRDFGSFTEDYLVGTFNNFIGLAAASEPLMESIAGFFSDRDLTRGLAGTLALSLPMLSHFSRLLVNIIPDVLQFSRGMSEVVMVTTQLLSGFIDATVGLIEFLTPVRNGNRFLGRMIGVLLTLTSVVLLSTKVWSLLNSQILANAAALVFSATKASLEAGALTAGAAAAKTKAAAMLGLSGATWTATTAMAAFVAVATVGVGLLAAAGAVGFLSNNFLSLSGDIDEATGSLREFQRQQSSMQRRNGVYMGDLDRSVYVNVHDGRRFEFNGDMSEAEFEDFVDRPRNSFKMNQPGTYNG